MIQTKDLRPLPCGFGQGSTTLKNWINDNLANDPEYAFGCSDFELPEPEEPEFHEPVYPASWGEPPMIQTMDYTELPCGFGFGSSTMVYWINGNLANDPEYVAAHCPDWQNPEHRGNDDNDGVTHFDLTD